MAAFYTLMRGATLPRASALLIARVSAPRGRHRNSIATPIRGAIAQMLLGLWSVLAVAFLLLVLGGFLVG